MSSTPTPGGKYISGREGAATPSLTRQQQLEAGRKQNKQLENERDAEKSGELGVNGGKDNLEGGTQKLTAEIYLDFWVNNYIKFRRLDRFYRCRLGQLDDKKTQLESKKDLEDWLRKDAEHAANLTTTIPGIDHEFALDLSILGLYDIAVLIDDSASMSRSIRKNGIKKILKAIVQLMGFVSGSKRGVLTVRFLNSGETASKIKTGKEVDNLIDEHEFGGETRLAQGLNRKILAEFVYRLKPGPKVQIESFRKIKKPLLIFLISDGEEDKKRQANLKTVIQNLVLWLQRAPKGPGDRAVAFQFVGLDNDSKAEEFFRALDDQTKPVDISDIIDYYQLGKEEAEDVNLKEVLAGDNAHARRKVAKLVLGPLLKRFDELEGEEGNEDDEFYDAFDNTGDIPIDEEDIYSSDDESSGEEEDVAQ